MRRLLPLAVLILPLALTFCDNSDSNNLVPIANGNVVVHDDCDSVSFNAGIAPGTCVKAGGTTLSAFNAELSANHSVAAWNFTPATLTVTVGGAVTALNTGGEKHTFTEVENFGGGFVPALNTASGMTTVAPECAALAGNTNALIASGGSFTADPETSVGVEHYQCGIHPWMRANVTVVAR
jgi:plastocyanin